MRIFVDVGAHEGQTITEVARRKWGFDEIHAIEPMPKQAQVVRARFRDKPRVKVHEFALAGYDGPLLMYGDNELLEASLFQLKDDVDERFQTKVLCVEAAGFIQGLGIESSEAPQLFVNLNCEGAEIPILSNLIATGTIWSVTHMLIDWDCRKIPDMVGAAEAMMNNLRAIGYDNWRDGFPEAETHQEQIAIWLAECGL